MVMDPRLRGFSGYMNGMGLGNQPISVLPNHNLVAGHSFENSLIDHNLRPHCYVPSDDPKPRKRDPYSTGNHEEDIPEDCDFSDTILGYISQILMEEDMEDKTCMFRDSLGLQAAEKSFYDVLGKNYPPSPEPHKQSYVHQNGQIPNDNLYGSYSNGVSNDGAMRTCLVDNNWIKNMGAYSSFQVQSLPVSCISQSSCSSLNSVITSVDGTLDSPSSTLWVPDQNTERQSIWQFKRGVEEARKFLPIGNELFVKLDMNGSLTQVAKGGMSDVALKIEKRDEEEYSPSGSRGRKNPHRDDADLEEVRSNKQAAIYIETTLRSDMFDDVLLCKVGKGLSDWTALRDALKEGASKSLRKHDKPKGSTGGKLRGKKQSGKKDVVDLRTLLIHCAQAVAADDHRSAHDLLRLIRQHSSPIGDGNQRLANCFADGLEARLAGTGSQIYKGLVKKRTPAADILKAYRLYIAACPFRKLSNFTANKTIQNMAENAKKLHIIDFGILYGFQWPTLIQRLSLRPDGPPKIRITGIDFPQPGFRPAEQVEETGRRLAAYAEHFKVPFEYNAIAKKWETIQLEELRIEKDEFLVVNCLYRSKNLLDETVVVDSSRDIFLNFISKINPAIFVHGIINGAYNAPFFVTRFREALFHFSAMFDMLETIVPRVDQERMLLEKEIFGGEALNVIACEGWERVERPETYKQWHVRHLRAGFAQVPLDREIVNKATNRVRSSYHRDFIIDEDSRWMLQGWKGRIVYALSAWKPA
ncbi:scarecrow-like protein 9-like isoform X1 [Tripterygium wilfordii]|uniref:Scarecrow-like protein 9-like isoform X1 n=1 Tax=Tripterygium wilfordii TaxID=458696 RepID=A0A7J7DX44_TRIWF|nr:scarecrow-like protein 9 [Tripterygium wilfordii]KAF5750935.1 scarecrow-like protein 9-like isoform X1 [Tripterygium wilfordii]